MEARGQQEGEQESKQYIKQERKEGNKRDGRQENKQGNKSNITEPVPIVPPAEIFGKLAGKHATVRPVHLLGNVLHERLAPGGHVQRGALLDPVLLRDIGGQGVQTPGGVSSVHPS